MVGVQHWKDKMLVELKSPWSSARFHGWVYECAQGERAQEQSVKKKKEGGILYEIYAMFR